jgi:hypothetical protein
MTSAAIFVMLLISVAHPQNLAPVSNYKLDLRDAMKCPDGLRFHWAMAPDASLLITMWDPRHEFTVLRLTSWETRKPKIELIKIAVNLPDFATGCPPDRDPIIDPEGHYLVVRSPEVNIGENGSDKQKWEAALSVVDLRAFRVVSTTTVFGGLAGGGHLFFSKGGGLMLHTTAKLGSALPFAVTVFALPALIPVATCDYEQLPAGSGVTKTSESCPAVMGAAHLASIQELGDLPLVDDRINRLAGPDCDFEAIAPQKDVALYRCGKEHFGDPYGDFGIMFWHALKILSTSDGMAILSLPLNFYDSTSSGLFAYNNGQNYLITRHGSRLNAYPISR